MIANIKRTIAPSIPIVSSWLFLILFLRSNPIKQRVNVAIPVITKSKKQEENLKAKGIPKNKESKLVSSTWSKTLFKVQRQVFSLPLFIKVSVIIFKDINEKMIKIIYFACFWNESSRDEPKKYPKLKNMIWDRVNNRGIVIKCFFIGTFNKKQSKKESIQIVKDKIITLKMFMGNHPFSLEYVGI